MGDEAVSMSSWHLRYDRQREYNKRKHSPVCTEAMMKGYRCMKKFHGVRQQCEDIIDAMHQCRNREQKDTIQRKPTNTAAATTTAPTTPTPTTA